MTITPATFRVAHPERRFQAFVIDRAIGWTLFALAGFEAWWWFFRAGEVVAGIGLIAGVLLLVSLVCVFMLGHSGSSPGRAMFGLRVVDAGTGEPIGLLRALVRTTILGVGSLPMFGLGLATLAWTAVEDRTGERRGWHDLKVNSVVVDIRRVPVEEQLADDRPRQVVNLTAMRLMPVKQTEAPVVPAPQIPHPPQPQAPVQTPPPPQASVPPPEQAPAQAPEQAQQPAHHPTPAPALGTPHERRRRLEPPEPSGPSGPPVGTSTSGASTALQGPVMPESPSPLPPPGPPESPAQPRPQATPPGSPTQFPSAPGRHSGPGPTGSAQRRQGAAPAKWRLEFDSGETFLVEGLGLVGRKPEGRRGEPVRHIVPLLSDDMSISKTHAQFHLAADGVLVVMDRGSTNGSLLIRRGVARELSAGRPATLVEGDRVRFGDREMRVVKDQS